MSPLRLYRFHERLLPTIRRKSPWEWIGRLFVDALRNDRNGALDQDQLCLRGME